MTFPTTMTDSELSNVRALARNAMAAIDALHAAMRPLAERHERFDQERISAGMICCEEGWTIEDSWICLDWQEVSQFYAIIRELSA